MERRCNVKFVVFLVTVFLTLGPYYTLLFLQPSINIVDGVGK